MDHLDQLESESVYILREAFNRIEKLAMLWSLGKDSNTMVWLAKKAFFGHVPFPVVHVDTGKKFPEMYAFRSRYAREWNLKLIVRGCPPVEAVDPSLPPAARSAARKTLGLKAVLAEFGFQGIIAGIRRDEEAIRAKERVFSPRGEDGAWNLKDQPPEFWNQFNTDVPAGAPHSTAPHSTAPHSTAHLRVHPLLHWTEIDIWRYVQRENIPCVDLYFAKAGKRYRSLGDQDITFPIASNASSVAEILAELQGTRVPERAGRAMDHEAEDAFERLRADGYM